MFTLRLFAVLLLLLLRLPMVGQVSVVERAALIERAGELQTDPDSACAVLLSVTKDAQGQLIVDSLSGLALHLLGNKYYGNIGDTTAAQYYEQAIEVRDVVFREPHNQRAHSRLNLAMWLRKRGDFDNADTRLREALNIYEQVEKVDSLNWLKSLNEVAKQAEIKQDMTVAVSACYRAVSLREEFKNVTLSESFVTSYRAALILLRMQRPREALPHAHHALAIATSIGEVVSQVDAYNLLAIVQRELGETDNGYRTLLQGVVTSQKVDWSVASLPDLYLNLAEYYGGQGALEKCLEYDNRARIEYLRHGRSVEYYSSDRTPDALAHWGRYPEALSMVNERIDSLQKQQSPPTIPLIDLLSVRARVYAELGRRDAALTDYNELFKLQDRLRQGVASPESRQYLSGNLHPFFDHAIRLYYEAYSETGDTTTLWRAFDISERARAYSLLATLQSDSRLSAEEAKMRAQLAQLERRVSLGDSGLITKLQDARLRIDRLHGRQIAEPTVTNADRETLLGHLASHEATLLEYHLGEEISLLFVVTPNGQLNVYQVPETDQLSERIAAWRASIDQSRYRRKSLRSRTVQDSLDRQYADLGYRLTEQLLPESFRKSLHLRPRLIIVPDGGLNYLPFAALPLHQIEAAVDYRKVDYLQREVELQYAYSAAYLLRVSQPDTTNYRSNLLAFAPSFGAEAEAGATRGGKRLGALSYNLEEVHELEILVPEAEVYAGNEASRQCFLERVGGSRILHLSSHGSVDPSDPNLSYIAFTQWGDSLQRDELIYFNDLYQLPLHNELTVLSACETSLGKLAPGETTMSLASAFAAAGARSTLTTLWKVDDAATKEVIVEFYRHLVAGDSRSAALARAQDSLREADYAHPFYWAGLSLHGAVEPLTLAPATRESTAPQWSYLAVGTCLALLIGYARRNRRTKTVSAV